MSDNIVFACGRCGKRYAIASRLAGQAVKCRGCEAVLRVPERSTISVPDEATSKAASRKPTQAPGQKSPTPQPMPKPQPKEAPPPGLDLYALEDEPTPAARPRNGAAWAEGGGPDGGDAPLTLPRAGSMEPLSAEQKKKRAKRSARNDRAKSTLANGPSIGGLVGVLFFVGLFGLRVYNRVNRAGRGWEDRSAATLSAPVDPGPIVAPAFPDLPPAQPVAPGVVRHEVRFGAPWGPGSPPGRSGKLWVYLPKGDHAPGSLPGIVIAGAGSYMVTGMDLAEGDMPEHIPWAQAGFAVLAYELDGMVRGDPPADAEFIEGARGFVAARAGLVNAKNAVDYLVAKVPQVDANRLFAVGHSSAGTEALLVAENDPRIKGVVAFAPGTFDGEFGAMISGLTSHVPGIEAMRTVYDPGAQANVARLTCPVMLFTALDDDVVPPAETQGLHAKIGSWSPCPESPVLHTVPSGGHYDPMLNPGIARAIDWVREHAGTAG